MEQGAEGNKQANHIFFQRHLLLFGGCMNRSHIVPCFAFFCFVFRILFSLVPKRKRKKYSQEKKTNKHKHVSCFFLQQLPLIFVVSPHLVTSLVITHTHAQRFWTSFFLFRLNTTQPFSATPEVHVICTEHCETCAYSGTHERTWRQKQFPKQNTATNLSTANKEECSHKRFTSAQNQLLSHRHLNSD